MMLTSLFGGMALANAKLGAVHGFAGPLGGLSHAPHGALCAALLPASLRVNLRALRARGEACHLERFRELAALLTGKEDAQPEDAVSRIEELTKELRVVPLSGLGVSRELALRSVPMARRASSMKGNPIELTDEELEELVTSA
jgi:alcohol dehydrogenase class IV